MYLFYISYHINVGADAFSVFVGSQVEGCEAIANVLLNAQIVSKHNVLLNKNDNWRSGMILFELGLWIFHVDWKDS